jgi:uncharacterized protein YegL
VPSPTRRVLPFYVVVALPDPAPPAVVAAVNAVLPELRDALACHPALADLVRIGLIDFADDARTLLPVADLLGSDVGLPVVEPRAGVSCTAALHALHAEIDADIVRFAAEDTAMHRPCGWLLLAGEPTDDTATRAAAFAALTQPATYPNLVVCGTAVQPELLRSLVHPATGPAAMAAYRADPGRDPAEAAAAFTEMLVETVIESGHATDDARSELLLPLADDLPPGIRLVPGG